MSAFSIHSQNILNLEACQDSPLTVILAGTKVGDAKLNFPDHFPVLSFHQEVSIVVFGIHFTVVFILKDHSLKRYPMYLKKYTC